MARDGSRAAQDKLAQLMENLAAVRTSWAEEVSEGAGFRAAGCRLCPLCFVLFFLFVEQKAELLAAVGAAQRELEGVNRAHDELRRTHEELRSQAAAQARLLRELEVHAEAPSPTNAQVAVFGG